MRLFAALIAATYLASSPVFAEKITGKARVIDGDTIVINEERVRLAGIDACEIDQYVLRPLPAGIWLCGRPAAGYMVAHTAGKDVTCEWSTRGRYKRILGQCRAGKHDLNAGILGQGLAVVYRNKNGAATIPEYEQIESDARESQIGLWASPFVNPKDWRKGERSPYKIVSWRLYRNSLNGPENVHVATFDMQTRGFRGSDFNKESCEYTRDLYKTQPGIKTRFWCIKAQY